MYVLKKASGRTNIGSVLATTAIVDDDVTMLIEMICSCVIDVSKYSLSHMYVIGFYLALKAYKYIYMYIELTWINQRKRKMCNP